MKNSRSLLSYVFILVALFYVLKLLDVIPLSFMLVVAYAFIIYGVVSAYISLGTRQRAGLFLGTIIFLTGIALFTTENFTIIQPGMIVFPSTLFILGAGFLMLYINESSNRIFLYSSLLLIPLGLISIWLVKRVAVIGLANRLAAGLADYYPVFIVLFGVYILSSKRK